MKNNINRNTANKANPRPRDAKALEALNAIFGRLEGLSNGTKLAMDELCAATDRRGKIDPALVERLDRNVRAAEDAYKKASADFDAIKAALAPLKFDCDLGRYVFAIDDLGRETFSVRVTRSQTATIRIAALSEKDAFRRVAEMESEGKLEQRFSPASIVMENRVIPE